jgi:hypothetical protein
MKQRYPIPALLCALLVAYPLSLGPVAMLYVGGEPPKLLLDLYVPLNWVVRHSPETLQETYTWYMELWLQGH